MRNFSKTLISMAAVMAVGSAMAAGAMAAMTAEYDGSANITISGTSSHGASQTMLVVAGASVAQYAAADEAKTDRVIVGVDDDTYTASESTIKQIDQIDNVATGVAAFNKDVVVGTLADGNYKVLVNGVEGTVEEYTFTVNTLVEEPEVEYETITIGDVDRFAGVGASDASAIANYVAGKVNALNQKVGTIRVDENSANVTIGDVDRFAGVGASDASAIANYVAGKVNALNQKVGTVVKVEK